MPSAFKRVERVFDFAQAALDVGKRQRREEAEAAGMVCDQPGSIVVGQPYQTPGLIGIAKPKAWGGDRQDGRRDAGLAHVVERFLQAPASKDRHHRLMAAHGGKIVRRAEMMMDVDAMKVCLRHGPLRSALMHSWGASSMSRRRREQRQLLLTRLGPNAIFIDKAPIYLETKARLVAELQVTVA